MMHQLHVTDETAQIHALTVENKETPVLQLSNEMQLSIMNKVKSGELSIEDALNQARRDQQQLLSQKNQNDEVKDHWNKTIRNKIPDLAPISCLIFVSGIKHNRWFPFAVENHDKNAKVILFDPLDLLDREATLVCVRVCVG